MPRRAARLAPPSDDASTVWSTWIQPVDILDVTREQRFRDEVKGVLWPGLGLKRGGVAVDVGCGSGILTRVLARWMGPGSMVYGVDRDASFVAYAAARAKQERLGRRTRYLQGDAFSLPLPDNVADAVTSYTLIEHVPQHVAFVREQMRVCRPGGRVSIMEVFPGGGLSAQSPSEWGASTREQELWKPMDGLGQARVDKPWQVGAHDVGGLHGLVSLLEEAGLQEILVDGFATAPSLDDARVTPEMAQRRLAAEEEMLVKKSEQLALLVEPRLPARHVAELTRLIRARFARRRRWLRSGKRIWDWNLHLSAVVSGRVR